MNRTLRYKLAYVVAFLVLGSLTMLVWRGFDYSSETLIVVVLILLVPGRIQGYLWRDFFRGRRLMSAGQWQPAAQHFEKFLSQIRDRPWLRRLMGLSWSFYTWDVDAMTRNNLGAIKMQLADLAAAEKHFTAACDLDPEYPVPHFNLAILSQMRGDPQKAQALFARAQALGFTGGSFDQVCQLAQEALARVEGQGSTPQG